MNIVILLWIVRINAPCHTYFSIVFLTKITNNYLSLALTKFNKFLRKENFLLKEYWYIIVRQIIKISIGQVTENIDFTFAKVYTNITEVQRWFMKFKIGNFSLENESREKSRNVTNNILTDIVENNSPEKSIIS